MPMIDLKKSYKDSLSELLKATGIRNVMEVPRITKVTINVGLGPHRQNKDMVKYIADTLSIIAGQKPVPTKAKKAIAGFKIRQGDVVGYRVTLRGSKMYDFVNRFLNIVLPRIREFRGIDPKKIDKTGNLTIGLKDQIAFPEVGTDAIDKQFGMTIAITVKNSNQQKSLEALRILGFPLKNE